MNRRTVLKQAGTLGVFGSLAGCPGRDSTQTETPADSTPTDEQGHTETPEDPLPVPDSYASRFDMLVDVVSAGADPDGNEPINDVLSETVADSTLFYFPEGRYLLDGQWRREVFEDLAFYGPDATLVPPDGYSGNLLVLGSEGNASGLVFDGLTFDVGAELTGPRALHLTVTDDLLVRDLSVRGVQDTDQGLTRFDVTDPEGTGRVEGMYMPDGGEPGTRATGCLVGPRSNGEVTFSDCHITGFPDNGLYASPAPGPVNVIGGYYANNGISNVRVSGESVVRDVHVVCDEAIPGILNMRGIRLREGSGALIENCRVDLLDVTQSDGAVELSTGMGAATIRNTTIRVDADGIPAIRAKPPSETLASDGGTRIACENVSIIGDAAGGQSVQVVERNESTFDGVCLEQTGTDRDGFRFLRSTDSLISDTSVSVTGEALITRDSTVRTEGLRTEGADSCNPDGE